MPNSPPPRRKAATLGNAVALQKRVVAPGALLGAVRPARGKRATCSIQVPVLRCSHVPDLTSVERSDELLKTLHISAEVHGDQDQGGASCPRLQPHCDQRRIGALPQEPTIKGTTPSVSRDDCDLHATRHVNPDNDEPAAVPRLTALFRQTKVFWPSPRAAHEDSKPRVPDSSRGPATKQNPRLNAVAWAASALRCSIPCSWSAKMEPCMPSAVARNAQNW